MPSYFSKMSKIDVFLTIWKNFGSKSLINSYIFFGSEKSGNGEIGEL